MVLTQGNSTQKTHFRIAELLRAKMCSQTIQDVLYTSKGFHFSTSFVEGPNEPQRGHNGEINMSKALIGSDILCLRVRETYLTTEGKNPATATVTGFFGGKTKQSTNHIKASNIKHCQRLRAAMLQVVTASVATASTAVCNIKVYKQISWQVLVQVHTRMAKRHREK